MARITKAKDGAIAKFGDSVKNHDLLAKGAEVSELEARSTPLDDFGGTGAPIILRRFSYQLPPKTQYNKKDILAHHLPRIQPFLWKDGLEQIADAKVVLGKRGKFDIFVTCQPRRGELLNERPLSLQEAINANSNKQ